MEAVQGARLRCDVMCDLGFAFVSSVLGKGVRSTARRSKNRRS